jgi:hypothetical protein
MQLKLMSFWDTLLQGQFSEIKSQDKPVFIRRGELPKYTDVLLSLYPGVTLNIEFLRLASRISSL